MKRTKRTLISLALAFVMCAGLAAAPEAVFADQPAFGCLHTFSAGQMHTVAVRSDGSLWAWGNNHFGQLGDGTTTDRHAPARIGNEYNWAAVSTSTVGTMAIKIDGSLWGWGADSFGSLGYGRLEDGRFATHHTPVRIGSEYNWAAVSIGNGFTVAIRTDGSLWAWGANFSGSLGDGTTTTRTTPVRIGNDNDWIAASAGHDTTVAVRSDGSLWAWGAEDRTADSTTPARIGNDSGWVAASAGANHRVAVRSDGSLWTWGWNLHGELGDGTAQAHTFVRTPMKATFCGHV